MKKREKKGIELREVKTIGDVKTSIQTWSRVNTYKTRERVQGRSLKMPEAADELIQAGLDAKGII